MGELSEQDETCQLEDMRAKLCEIGQCALLLGCYALRRLLATSFGPWPSVRVFCRHRHLRRRTSPTSVPLAQPEPFSPTFSM